MAKASISIGVDDATGQPASAPKGPYITDEDDGSRRRRKRTPRRAAGSDTENQRPRNPEQNTDLASRRKGPAQP
jgi:hypothetical protein